MSYEHHDCDCCPPRHRPHVHEVLGSTVISGFGEVAHNHRFAAITGPAIPTDGTHVHEILTRTDNTNHYHTIRATTGPAIYVGGGRHVHFEEGTTSYDNGHTHRYRFATLIEDPT